MSVMPTPDSNSSVMMWSQRRIAVSQVSGLGRQMGSELLVAAGLAHLRGGSYSSDRSFFLGCGWIILRDNGKPCDGCRIDGKSHHMGYRAWRFQMTTAQPHAGIESSWAASENATLGSTEWPRCVSGVGTAQDRTRIS